MRSSEPVYYNEPYERSITVTILDIIPLKDHDGIILDRTICYPEGGGQPGDQGFLGGSRILDTQIDASGAILHFIERPHDLCVSDVLPLNLDWQHRYDYMQQHTAQHLLSGTLHRIFGIGTVSVHLGHEDLSIELDVEELSEEQVRRIEDAVNEVVTESVPVTADILTQEQSHLLGLRRPVKVETDVRIVRIGSYDTIACGGVHVRDTNELRYVQYLRSERIRGHLRTSWVAGDRSIELIRRNNCIVDSVGTALSLPAGKIVEGISSLQSQLADCRYHAHGLSVRIASLLLHAEIHGSESGTPIVLFDATSWTEEEFTSLPEALLPLKGLALCAVRERPDGKLAWVVALKEFDTAHKLFQEVREAALPLIGGKGGGKPPLWQGIGTDQTGKDSFLAMVETLFVRWLRG